MEEEPSETAVAKFSRTEYIMKFYDDWSTIFHGNAFYDSEINGNPIIYIGDLTLFEIRAWAVSHVSRTQGNSRLKDIPTCSSTDIP